MTQFSSLYTHQEKSTTFLEQRIYLPLKLLKSKIIIGALGYASD